MLNENDFRDKAEETLERLEERLLPLCEIHGFDVETGGGMVTIIFEEPIPTKFIISPHTAARQIWVSALATSYKFDWDEGAASFVLDKTREPFLPVIGKLISTHLGSDVQL